MLHQFQNVRSCLFCNCTLNFQLSKEIRFEAHFGPIEADLTDIIARFVSKVHTHAIYLFFEKHGMLTVVIKGGDSPLNQGFNELFCKVDNIDRVSARPSNEGEFIDVKAFQWAQES